MISGNNIYNTGTPFTIIFNAVSTSTTYFSALLYCTKSGYSGINPILAAATSNNSYYRSDNNLIGPISTRITYNEVLFDGWDFNVQQIFTLHAALFL
jgi:hypothetical protein